ncbi:unnamed protein product [Albugo candida]|uniref:Uncharacterized protein n=1 Tax=Albugo candida TaxID=65357 RepID=A0A024FVG8_9STRA|nr:unnamed protein product [Albugo candida]|eukprot:CCI11120.1 unnamed protein product [Albugo candida]
MIIRLISTSSSSLLSCYTWLRFPRLARLIKMYRMHFIYSSRSTIHRDQATFIRLSSYLNLSCCTRNEADTCTTLSVAPNFFGINFGQCNHKYGKCVETIDKWYAMLMKSTIVCSPASSSCLQLRFLLLDYKVAAHGIPYHNMSEGRILDEKKNQISSIRMF